MYLGAKIGAYFVEKEEGRTYWSMGSQTYIKESAKNIEANLQKQHRELKSKVSSPLPISYSSKLDTIPLYNNDDVNKYHLWIGVHCWAVGLGRVDMCTAYHIFAHVK